MLDSLDCVYYSWIWWYCFDCLDWLCDAWTVLLIYTVLDAFGPFGWCLCENILGHVPADNTHSPVSPRTLGSHRFKHIPAFLRTLQPRNPRFASCAMSTSGSDQPRGVSDIFGTAWQSGASLGTPGAPRGAHNSHRIQLVRIFRARSGPLGPPLVPLGLRGGHTILTGFK